MARAHSPAKAVCGALRKGDYGGMAMVWGAAEALIREPRRRQEV